MELVERLRLRAALGSLVFAIEGNGCSDQNGFSLERAVAFREARKLLEELGIAKEDVTVSREDFLCMQGIDPENFRVRLSPKSGLSRRERLVLCAVAIGRTPEDADAQLTLLLAEGLVAETERGWVVTDKGSQVIRRL